MRTDYEQLAGRYDEDRAKYSYARDDIVKELLAQRDSVRTVDIGCGTGRWLEAQRTLIDDVRLSLLGIDPSPAMLAEAHAKGIDNLVAAPAERLPLRDASVDYLVSAYCFHHYTDKELALDEVRRVLTSGGVFRINNIEPTASEGGWLSECFPETIAIDATRFWPPARIGAALEARGFTVEIAIETERETVAATDALADAERRVISQLAVLDDDAYTRGVARLRETAAAPDATFSGTTARLCLTARLS